MSTSVSLKGLRRHFPGNDRPAVVRFDLEVAPGETICLVGPSGCGKSTTLRMVAGLETPDSGQVLIDGHDMTGVAPQSRDVAMVFQGFALYPHLTVEEIMAFPLKMQKVPRKERRRRVAETAEMLGITRLLDRRPGQLSGGERQRVAMGRAIVRRPRLFLFDEPLSNLDAALRNELRVELGQLLRRLEATALYVTHDQAEAMTLASRIVVLNNGEAEQIAAPREIYEQPASRFVASFFGTPPMNIFDGQCAGGKVRAGPIEVPAPVGHAEGPAVFGVRPEHLSSEPGDSPGFSATVVAVEPLGAETHLVLEADAIELRARIPGFSAPGLGSSLQLSVDPAHVHWFDPESGRSRGAAP